MSFNYFNGAPNDFHGRPYSYLPNQIPRSYHHQPTSPSDGNSPTGGGDYTTTSSHNHEDNRAHIASQSYQFGGQPNIPFSGLPESPYSGMDSQSAGLTGSLTLPSEISGAGFPPSQSSMFGDYTMDAAQPQQYTTSLTRMHGLGTALNADILSPIMFAPSPTPSESSLEGDGSPYSSPSPPPPASYLPPHSETEEYLRRNLEIPRGVPVNLTALGDFADGKPPPISSMIKLAIWGSRHRMLTLQQIYDEVEKRYPHLGEESDKPWTRSIRHNLSLKAMFVRIERPVSHPGKGFYWAIDIRQGEGNKRDRKRRDNGRSRTEEEEESLDDEPSPQKMTKGRRGDRRGTHQALRIPQESQHAPGPSRYAHQSDSMTHQQPASSQGMSFLTPSQTLPPNYGGPNMRWDQRMHYAPVPSSSGHGPTLSHSQDTLPSMQPYAMMNMQMQMSPGGASSTSTLSGGFNSNYSLPPNIEHRPLRSNITESDPVLGMQNYLHPIYPQEQAQMTMNPAYLHGMPPSQYEQSSSRIGSRRPPPENREEPRRSRRSRAI